MIVFTVQLETLYDGLGCECALYVGRYWLYFFSEGFLQDVSKNDTDTRLTPQKRPIAAPSV